MSMGIQDIVKFLESMDQEASNIKKRVLEYCWWMRGGITYNEAMAMDQSNYKLIKDIVEQNLESTKKTGVSFI